MVCCAGEGVIVWEEVEAKGGFIVRVLWGSCVVLGVREGVSKCGGSVVSTQCYITHNTHNILILRIGI